MQQNLAYFVSTCSFFFLGSSHWHENVFDPFVVSEIIESWLEPGFELKQMELIQGLLARLQKL